MKLPNFLKIVAIVCFSFYSIAGFALISGSDIQMNLLRQESVPSIEYKYVVKTILPSENRWWKRGTHRLYAEEPSPKIVEAR